MEKKNCNRDYPPPHGLYYIDHDEIGWKYEISKDKLKIIIFVNFWISLCLIVNSFNIFFKEWIWNIVSVVWIWIRIKLWPKDDGVECSTWFSIWFEKSKSSNEGILN